MRNSSMKRNILPLVMAGVMAMPTNVLAQALIPPPPARPQLDGNGVDVQSADLTYSQSLMSIGPQGIGGLEYSTHFSNQASRDSFTSMFIHSYGFSYNTVNASIGNFADEFTFGIPNNGNGSSVGTNYYMTKDGTFVSFAYPYASGCDGMGNCTDYTLADYLEYPNGVRMTFHYKSASGGGLTQTRLQSVTTNTGYQMKFTYQSNSMTSSPTSVGPWRTIASVVAINNAVEYCDPDADTCTLTGSWPQVQYTTLSGYSSAVLDPLGNETAFLSDPSTHSFSVKTADSSSANLVFAQSYQFDPNLGGLDLKVTSATINGRVTNYTYTYSSGAHTTTVVASSPLSQQFSYLSEVTGFGVTSVTDPLSHTTTFSYDSPFRRLLTTTAPEGNITQNIYDGSIIQPAGDATGNITQTSMVAKSGSGSPTLTESRTFVGSCSTQPKICNQPATYTDPRGNVTSYTYDSAHGGVLTETDPVDANGIHPVKRYVYALRRAWIKDAGGSYVAETNQIYVRTEAHTCATTAMVGTACAGGSSDEIVTTYDYGPDSGPNNLLLRGQVVTAGGVSLRTCYGYDQYGNKISETKPRAGLTSCP